MAIECRMVVKTVTAQAEGGWVQCGPDVPGATQVNAESCLKFPQLTAFDDGTWAILDHLAKSSETVSLDAHSREDNADWAAEHAIGTLELYITHPRSWDYFEPGSEYRLTIEKIRKPKNNRTFTLNYEEVKAFKDRKTGAKVHEMPFHAPGQAFDCVPEVESGSPEEPFYVGAGGIAFELDANTIVAGGPENPLDTD